MALDVLLVEDSPTRRDPIDQGLKSLGFNVFGPVPDGRQAARARETTRPDLALINFHDPKNDAAAAARRLNRDAPLPIVLLAPELDGKLLEQASRAQIYSYLIKPVEPRLLGQALLIAHDNFSTVSRLEQKAGHLRAALEARKTISRALGYLMDQEGVSPQEARQALEDRARRQGLGPEKLAQIMVAQIAGRGP